MSKARKSAAFIVAMIGLALVITSAMGYGNTKPPAREKFTVDPIIDLNRQTIEAEETDPCEGLPESFTASKGLEFHLFPSVTTGQHSGLAGCALSVMVCEPDPGLGILVRVEAGWAGDQVIDTPQIGDAFWVSLEWVRRNERATKLERLLGLIK